MGMMPSLRQLEYLVALADSGQFVEAARHCAVSQPAMSKQIREVEEMLGVVLFERVRPRVLVTPAGEEVVRRARLILAQSRELVDAANVHAGARRGTIRLGVIPTVAPYGLPGFLVKLRRAFPEASLVIRELQTDVLLEQLRTGGIDIGLLARPFDESGLVGPDLVFEPFVLVAPEGHPLCIPEVVRASELDGASLVLMEDGHCLRDQAIEVCAAGGRHPTASVTAASVSTLVRIVESGLGATLLPMSAISAEVRPGQGMLARSFGPSPPGRTLTLQWRATSPSRDWFLELGNLLRTHYERFNLTCPEGPGPPPTMRAIFPKDVVASRG
ncbi:MAG: LysR family hydrogen peroxide-inducible transcriptional activator [Bradymonadia bacterium]|jgi:LysR family hydrogen peroxide-inducible transcriptional activator